MTKYSTGVPECGAHVLYKVYMDDGSTAYYHPYLLDWECAAQEFAVHDKHLYTDYPEWVAQLR